MRGQFQYNTTAMKSNVLQNKKAAQRVFVATYTNEGLKFQIHLGPLKFEPHKRGRHPKLPVAVI